MITRCSLAPVGSRSLAKLWDRANVGVMFINIDEIKICSFMLKKLNKNGLKSLLQKYRVTRAVKYKTIKTKV